MPVTTATMMCSVCKEVSATRLTSSGHAHLPRNWRRHPRDDRPWCAECWKKAYYCTAIELPVVGPVNGDWKELKAALNACWRWSTEVANYTIVRLVADDFAAREPGMTKLPTRPSPDYAGARRLVPDMPTGSLTAVQHAVSGKYGSQRGDVLCGKQRRASFRWPQPFPVRGGTWSVRLDDGRRPIVTARLGAKRWELRLRGGREFKRQRAKLELLLAGDAKGVEMTFYERVVAANTHRTTIPRREPGGGQRRQHRVICKIVAWLPVSKPRGAKGTLVVRTMPGSFLAARGMKDRRNDWCVHADHVRQWNAEHELRLRRLADDTKATVRRERGGLRDRRKRICKKHEDRIATFLKQTAAHLHRYAKGRRFAQVVLDDSEHGYMPRFAYADFRRVLSESLAPSGIALVLMADLKAAKAAKRAQKRAAKELADLETLLTGILEEELRK